MSLTVEAVRERVESIGDVGDDDPEAAHGMEDDLYEEILHALVDGELEFPYARQVIAEALVTKSYHFPRWHA